MTELMGQKILKKIASKFVKIYYPWNELKKLIFNSLKVLDQNRIDQSHLK